MFCFVPTDFLSSTETKEQSVLVYYSNVLVFVVEESSSKFQDMLLVGIVTIFGSFVRFYLSVR